VGASGLGRVRSLIFVGAVGLFGLGCSCGGETFQHTIQGPDRVIAGVPATFSIDNQEIPGDCPATLSWFFDGATSATFNRTPVKKRQSGPRCVVSDETAIFTFARGKPGTERQATVSSEFNGGPGFLSHPDSSVGKKTVTVVTPATAQPPVPFGFDGPSGYLSGDRPVAVTTGSYKVTSGGDRTDVAVLNHGNPGHDDLVRVHPANANGTLGSTYSLDLGANHSVTDMVSGGLNNDGFADLAISNQNPDSAMYVSNSGAALTNPQNVPVGADPQGITSGLVNADSFRDLVTTNPGDDNVAVSLNNGSGAGSEAGRFAASAAYSTGANSDPDGLAVDDFNRDGDADIALARPGNGDVGMLLGHQPGDGFGTLTEVTAPNPARAERKVVTSDFNRDGKPDLAVANQGTDNVSLLINTTPTAHSAGGGPVLPSFSETLLPVGDQPVDIAVGDFNNDANTDLATANQGSGTASVLLNAGSAAFTNAINFQVGTSPRSVATGDFNGDHRADLALAAFGGPGPDAIGALVVVLAKSGTGLFAKAPRSTLGHRSTARARAARAGAAAKSRRRAHGARVRARARLRRLRISHKGKSSYSRDGVFRGRGWLVSGELTIRYRARRSLLGTLPRFLRHGVRARALGRFSGARYPSPTGRDRVAVTGLVVGRVRHHPRSTLCVRVRYDTASRRRSRARVLGGTGPLARFSGSGRMPAIGRTGSSRTGRLNLTVRHTGRHKLPRGCRTLLRRVRR
jgi:FG-GAP-like repeat